MELNPLSIPTYVAKLVTKELCELGIPPEVNSLENCINFSLPVNILINCARKQAHILIPRTLLLKIFEKKFIFPP